MTILQFKTIEHSRLDNNVQHAQTKQPVTQLVSYTITTESVTWSYIKGC